MRTRRKHKWFQFSLRTLLLTPVLVAFLWWWATWPMRTLREFNELVDEGNLSAAAGMVAFAPDYRMTAKEVAHQLDGQPHTLPLKRNWLDLLLARQRYNVSKTTLLCWVQEGSRYDHRVCERLTVERGKIRYWWGLTGYEHHAEERRARGLPPLDTGVFSSGRR